MMKGRKQVEARLRAIQKRRMDQLTTGLTKAMLYVQAQSQRVVPVDYGPLKASAFTRVDGAGTATVTVTTGYTAAYAVYVHEDLEKAHGAIFNAKYAMELANASKLRKSRKGGTTGPFRHYRGTNQTAKFLEGPFRQAISDGTFFGIVQAEMSK